MTSELERPGDYQDRDSLRFQVLESLPQMPLALPAHLPTSPCPGRSQDCLYTHPSPEPVPLLADGVHGGLGPVQLLFLAAQHGCQTFILFPQSSQLFLPPGPLLSQVRIQVPTENSLNLLNCLKNTGKHQSHASALAERGQEGACEPRSGAESPMYTVTRLGHSLLRFRGCRPSLACIIVCTTQQSPELRTTKSPRAESVVLPTQC